MQQILAKLIGNSQHLVWRNEDDAFQSARIKSPFGVC